MTPLLVLNERWRVASDDWLQWKLEVRNSKPGIKSSGWRGRSFCSTRKVLLRCISELAPPLANCPDHSTGGNF